MVDGDISRARGRERQELRVRIRDGNSGIGRSERLDDEELFLRVSATSMTAAE